MSESLGVATLELSTDSGRFNRELGQAEGRSHRFHSALKAGAIGAAAALGGLAIVARLGWSEFSENARVSALTASTIRSTGGAANVTAGHISDLAGKLMRLSGADDEAIQSGENMLLTFTGIKNAAGRNNDIFDQATRATLDMATAMNGGATPSAEQMRTTSIRLGKALQDPVKGAAALRKAGVALTDGQKKTIEAMVKSGNVMGAQKIILGELKTEFGGAAKAAGQTLPGKLNILKESMKNVAGTIVGKAAPALTDFANAAMKKGLPAIENFIKRGLGSMTPICEDVRAAFKSAGPIILMVIGGIGRELLKLKPVFAAIADIVAKTMQAIGAVIQKHSADIKTIFKDVGVVIKNLAAGVLPVLAFFFQKVLPKALDIALPPMRFFADVLKKLGPVIKIVGAVIAGFVIAVYAIAVAERVWAAGQWLLNAAMSANPIGLVVIAIAALVAGLVIAYRKSETFRDIVNGAFGAVKTAIGGFCNFFTETIPAAFHAVLAWVRSHWPEIATLLSGPFAPIVLLATDGFGIRSKLLGAFQNVLDWLGGLGSKITGVFSGAAGWLSSAGTSIITGLWNGLKGVWSSVSGWFGDLPGKIVGFYAGCFTWLGDKGANIITGLKNGITGAWSAVAGWFTGRAATIKGYFTGAVNWLTDKGANIITGFWKGIKNTYSADGWFASLCGKIKGYFGKAGEWLKDAGGKIIGGLTKGMQTGASAISSLIKAPINAVISAWNKLHLKIPGFSVNTHIPGVGKIGWGGYDIKTPNIPTLGTGGIVTSPTLAMIGERGPEAVVPLSRGGGIGDGVHIHFHNGTFIGSNADAVARELAGPIRNQLIKTGVRVGAANLFTTS